MSPTKGPNEGVLHDSDLSGGAPIRVRSKGREQRDGGREHEEVASGWQRLDLGSVTAICVDLDLQLQRESKDNGEEKEETFGQVIFG